jgi:Family of unknown function (DUF5681)
MQQVQPEPVKTGTKQVRSRNGQFKKGASGNPAGRPQGSRNRSTIAIDQLLEGHAEQLTATCIAAALAGDGIALRLCMERICPPRKHTAVTFAARAPQIRSLKELLAVERRTLQRVLEGQLTANDADALMGLLARHRQTIEVVELADRLEKLELRIQSKAGDIDERENS